MTSAAIFRVEDQGLLRCHYFEAGRCRSCSLIETPYIEQLDAKVERCEELLPGLPADGWLPAFSGGYRGFRNKAKLVVGGRAGEVTLGILGRDGKGVDLRECVIQAPEIAAVVPVLAGFLNELRLEPYDVPARRGEVKFVHVTCSPDAEFMLRFVVRTEHALGMLRSRVEALRALVPRARVISVNLLPEHKAVLEGDREELLLGSTLPMRLGTAAQPLILHLQPQSFFQTNTAVARELYFQVSDWARRLRPVSVWDLYCGVGGFALHCAAVLPDAAVLGVEISSAAIESAVRSASEAGVEARFLVADATAFALAAAQTELPELLVVNPPRRGIGAELASWIEHSGINAVVYSSCNPESLARDLAEMPSYRLREGRVFDMFPHTAHLEVAVLLER